MTNARQPLLSLAISTTICAFVLALGGCTPEPGPGGPGPDQADAGAPPAPCNHDGVCGAGETLANCPQDCHCGDGTCQADESTTSCAADCHSVCGDGTCQADESATSCTQDCTATLTVQNNSTYTIYYFYARTCTGSWSTNLLSGVISPSNDGTLAKIPPGCWYFKAVASTGTYWVTNATTLEAGKTYTWPLGN